MTVAELQTISAFDWPIPKQLMVMLVMLRSCLWSIAKRPLGLGEDVYENGAEKVFEILFASIDETLNHLKPDNRKVVEMTAMRRRQPQDTLHATWITCRETQALLARSQG